MNSKRTLFLQHLSTDFPSDTFTSLTSIGPIVASKSFSLNGVIESGSEPITMRLDGLPEVLDFVATTLFPFPSVADELPAFLSVEPLREC